MLLLLRWGVRAWAWFSVGLWVCAACKPKAAPAELPVEQPAKVAATPAKVPDDDDGVVAEVNGWAISKETFDRQLSYYPEETSPQDVLVEIIDRRIVELQAEQMGVQATDSEVAAAAEGVAQQNGLTVEALKGMVAERTKMSWEHYEDELRAQILDFKVMQLLGVQMTTNEAFAQQQARVKACLRAATEIEVHDEALQLPPNPYDLQLTLVGLTFEGTVALDAKTLQSAVLDNVPPGPACDVLLAVEPRLFQTYLEAGYLRAKIDVQWPDAPQPETTLAVVVDAGAKHKVGTIGFDQTSLAAARRLDEKSLRKIVAKVLEPGDVAAGTKLNEAGAQLNELLKTMSRPPATMQTNLVEGKDVVNLTFVLVDG